MKKAKQFRKAFGLNEFGFIDFPLKISNVKISRIVNSEDRGGCTYCFPHGIETTNSTVKKNFKNWKNEKPFQWSN